MKHNIVIFYVAGRIRVLPNIFVSEKRPQLTETLDC